MKKMIICVLVFICLFQLNSLSEAAVLDSSSKSSTGGSALSSFSESKTSSASKASTEDSASKASTEEKASVGEPAEVFGRINSSQLFSVGEEIYRESNMELETSESNDYIKTITDVTIYTYVRFRNNKITILQENLYTTDILDLNSSPEPKTEQKVNTKNLSIPVDHKKQGLLETVDGKELVITIVDEDKRIAVEGL